MKCRDVVKAVLSIIAIMGFAVAVNAATRGVSDKEIVIGTQTALSGPVAGWGIDAANGTRMRFDEANKTGGIHGRKIRYVVEDSQYRVPLAVQKANKLFKRDKIFLMIGSIGTPMNNALFKAQFKLNIPNLFPYSFARSMVKPHHRLKFQSGSLYYDQMRAGIKYFVEQKNKKRICMMHVDTEYGVESLDAVRDQLKLYNMKLTERTSHKSSETSFVGAITKLRKAKCDVIAMAAIIRDTMIPVATARKLGWDVDMFGILPSCNSIVVEKGGVAMNGFYVVTGLPLMYEDRATTVKQKTFFTKYKKRFGKAPGEVAQFAYISADLTVLALEKAGRNLTLNSFLNGMESIKNYKHMFGGPDISFGPNNHMGSNESILLMVKDKKWVPPGGKKMILTY